jgi:two-component system sensor histidine kinase CiaH
MHGLKRFAVRATGSTGDPFRTARWRLTLLYWAIVVLIVAILSSALYELYTHDAERLEGRHAVAAHDRTRLDGWRTVPEIADEATTTAETPSLAEYLETLGRSILLADLVTILIAAGLSYLLATRTLRPIKKAVEAEQRFFANAAHDLRTPLAVMQSEAEVALRSASSSKDARAVLKSSLEEIHRMSSMVDQMLDLARGDQPPKSGTQTYQSIDLAALARGMTAKLAARAEQRGITLSTSAEESARISGNPSSLERAIYNVLENALAYTPSGGKVDVSVRRDGSHVVLAVADSGIGIDPIDIPHITEPFYRGDQARGAHTGGAGLGLTIAKAAMDEHRGELVAASAPGEGTTILLRFPALPA